jgi:hypothetical protein
MASKHANTVLNPNRMDVSFSLNWNSLILHRRCLCSALFIENQLAYRQLPRHLQTAVDRSLDEAKIFRTAVGRVCGCAGKALYRSCTVAALVRLTSSRL